MTLRREDYVQDNKPVNPELLAALHAMISARDVLTTIEEGKLVFSARDRGAFHSPLSTQSFRVP